MKQATTRFNMSARRSKRYGGNAGPATAPPWVNGLSQATVSRILRPLKLSHMRDLDPSAMVQRYEHAVPSDLPAASQH